MTAWSCPIRRFLSVAIASMLVFLMAGCGGDEPAPFSIEVIPDEITPAVPGQRCVFMVVATDEGEGGSKRQPVNLSATVSGVTVTIEPQAASPGLVAEVTVIPDEGIIRL